MADTSSTSASSFARRLIHAVRRSSRRDLQALARWLVSRRSTRTCLNLAYNRLSLARQASAYALLAKMFREQPQRHFAGGEWRVDVGSRSAALPLSRHDIWLEWDLALSMLGHDPDIICTYLELLRCRPPKLFLDVGANYGLHSLFFLIHDISTVSFEPNAKCHEYFRQLAVRNNVSCDLWPVALGAEEGWADIAFPERETWLGSSNPEVQDDVSRRYGELARIRVPQTTLDAFTRRDGRRPDLIKIDTEGNEAAVLEGARETLGTCRPWVIFESWRDPARTRLFALFEGIQYRVCPLPLRLPLPDVALDPTEFLEWRGMNFIALPGEAVSAQ